MARGTFEAADEDEAIRDVRFMSNSAGRNAQLAAMRGRLCKRVKST